MYLIYETNRQKNGLKYILNYFLITFWIGIFNNNSYVFSNDKCVFASIN